MCRHQHHLPLYIQFHIPDYNASLIITVKRRSEFRVFIPAIFYSTDIMLTQAAYFAKIQQDRIFHVST